jgi:methylated-DNA-[protein]-cysteine S-methyltransferase
MENCIPYNNSPMNRTHQQPRLERFQAVQATPFGAVGVRVESDVVAELAFLPSGSPSLLPAVGIAREACGQIAAYVKNPGYCFDLPLKMVGTGFQRQVWDAIAAIPRGSTRQYGEIARDLHAQPRAVGQACGDNAFPLVIPCHRVVSAAGLGGFAHHGSGFYLDVKRWLLAHEFDAVASGRLL